MKNILKINLNYKVLRVSLIKLGILRNNQETQNFTQTKHHKDHHMEQHILYHILKIIKQDNKTMNTIFKYQQQLT